MTELATEQEILAAALQSTGRAYQDNPSIENLRKWNAAKAEIKKAAAQAGDDEGERFKNLEAVCTWIVSQGYIVSPRTIRNHAERAGFPHRQKDGAYLKAEVATYAEATWDNPSRPADEPAGDHGDDIKRETARKLKLENDIKEGRYLLRSEEEQHDAQLLFGLKTAVANWGPFIIQDLLALAGPVIGDEASGKLGQITPELLARYRTQAAELFDSISRDGYLEVDDAD
jgi:hypothetical protein